MIAQKLAIDGSYNPEPSGGWPKRVGAVASGSIQNPESQGPTGAKAMKVTQLLPQSRPKAEKGTSTRASL